MSMMNAWIVLGIILVCVVSIWFAHKERHVYGESEGFATPVTAPSAAPENQESTWQAVCNMARETGFQDAYLTVTTPLPESCRDSLETWLETNDMDASIKMLEQTCLSNERRIQYLALMVLEHLREWMTTQRLGVTTFCRNLQMAIEKIPNPAVRQWFLQFQESCRAAPLDETGVSEACAISYRRWAYDKTPLPEACTKETLVQQIELLFQLAAGLRNDALVTFCSAVHKLVEEVQNPEMKAFLLNRAPCRLSEREESFKQWYLAFKEATQNMTIDGAPALRAWDEAFQKRTISEQCKEAGITAPSSLTPAVLDGRTFRMATLLSKNVVRASTTASPMFRILALHDTTLGWAAMADGTVQLRTTTQVPAFYWTWKKTIQGQQLQSLATGKLLGMTEKGVQLVDTTSPKELTELTLDDVMHTMFFRHPPMHSILAPLNAFRQLQSNTPLQGGDTGTAWKLEEIAETKESVLLLGDENRNTVDGTLRVAPPAESLFGSGMMQCTFTGWVYLEQNPDEALYLVNQALPLWRLRGSSEAAMTLLLRANARAYQIGVRVKTQMGEEVIAWSKTEVLPRQWTHLGVVLFELQVAFFAQGEVGDTVTLPHRPLLSSLDPLHWEVWPLAKTLRGMVRGWIGYNHRVPLEDIRRDMTRYSPIAVNQLTPNDIMAKREDGGVLLPMGEKSIPHNAVLHHPVGWSWPSDMTMPSSPVYLEYRWASVMVVRRILIQGAGLSYPLRWTFSFLDENSGIYIPLGKTLSGPSSETETVIHELSAALLTGAVRIHILEWRGRPALRAGFQGEIALPRRPSNRLATLPRNVFSAAGAPASAFPLVADPPASSSTRLADPPAASSTRSFSLSAVDPPAASDSAATASNTGSSAPAASTSETEASVTEVCKHFMTIQPDRYGSLADCVQNFYQRMTSTT